MDNKTSHSRYGNRFCPEEKLFMAAIQFYKSVYGTHFLAGDSWQSRSKHYQAMAGATVNYRLKKLSDILTFTKLHKFI